MADEEPTPRSPSTPGPEGARAGAAESGASSSRILERLLGPRLAAERYEVRGEVGRGGMGAVLKVWDEDLRRTLAMKVALEGKPAAQGSKSDVKLARFLEEAQITGQLDHPGVVPVHELGIDREGRVYFTMQLVKGRDLKAIFGLARSGEEGWTRTRALNVLLRVCETLAFAHEKQVIHRDVKPSNVMVGRFGEAYVMDWGLAKVLGREDPHDLRLVQADQASLSIVRTDRADAGRGDSSRGSASPLQTMDGDVVGTPCYMAPEQARGELDAIGPHTDVYAVGALLYELLSGRAPYLASEESLSPVAVLSLVMHRAPEPLAGLAPDVPAELVAICEKAMARDPRARYASMLAMAEDLRAYLEDRVVGAYEAGALAEFKKWVRRNRGMAAGVAAALLAALLGLGGVALVQSRSRAALERTNQELSLAHAQLTQANAELSAASQLERAATARALEQEEQARLAGYSANLAAAAASLADGDVHETRRRLELCPAALRGWEWRRLELEADSSSWSRACDRHGVPAPPDPLNQAFFDVDLDAEGRRAALATTWSTVLVVDAQTGATLSEFAHDPPAINVCFCPDGRIVTSGQDRALHVFAAETGEELGTLARSRWQFQDLDVAPDGERVLAATIDKSLRAWDLESGALLFEQPLEAAIQCLEWSPDGTRFATGSMDQRVRLHEGASGAVLLTLAGHAFPISDVSFDPSGRYLASGERYVSLELRAVGGSTARVWDARTGIQLGVFGGHREGIDSVSLLADGAGLLTSSLDGALRLFDLASGRARVYYGCGEPRFALPAAAGTVLAGGSDGTLRGWALGCATGVDLAGHPRDIVGLGPIGGHRVATLSRNGTLRVSDARTGEVLRDVREHAPAGHALACAPEGGRMATLVGRSRGFVLAQPGIALWDPEGGLLAAPELASPPVAVDLTPDGRLVAVALEDKSIRLLDGATGEERGVLAQEADVGAVALHPDGNRLVVVGEGKARLWDVAAGSSRELDEPGVWLWLARFGAGGELVAVAGGRTAALWRTDDLTRVASFHGHAEDIIDLALSSDGSRLATAGGDGTLRVWDARRGELLLVLSDQNSRPTALAFLPDGERLAAGFQDGSARVYCASRSAEDERAYLESQRVRAAAQRILAPLFEELVDPAAVRARLLGDDALDPRVVAAALNVAARIPATAAQLEEECRPLVRGPLGDRAELEQAVWKARFAASRDPEDADALRLLGMALCRLERYPEALEALERSDELHRRTRRARPETAAFLAITHHHLGRRAEAAADLERLRGLMSIGILRTDRDAMALLAEAESLLASGSP